MSRILRCHSLWKSVESFSGPGIDLRAGGSRGEPAARADSAASLQSLRACSACAGDYEDPDRTAGGFDEEEDDLETQTTLPEGKRERAEDEAGEADANGDEFPAP
jgi:hypothetical protein